MADWVFVSPHLDDVALSCGGAVAKAARTGNPVIVTVFAGIPSGESSEFARFQHDRWNLANDEAVQLRRREDELAARELGESVKTVWLDFLDAIYRDPGYSSDGAIFGRPLLGDRLLAEQIHDQLVQFPSERYVIPLGSGNHVDHQIVREAGLMLLRSGADVWAYAEVPYSLDPANLTAALLQTEFDQTVLVPLDEDSMQRKLSAVEQYRSQVPVLFRDRGEPARELEEYAQRSGDGNPAELLWRLSLGSESEVDPVEFDA